MQLHHQQVAEFMRIMGQDVHDDPFAADQKTLDLRVKLITEEIKEFQEAVDTQNTLEEFDALLDIEYVVLGTYHAFGLPYSETVFTNQITLIPKSASPEEEKKSIYHQLVLYKNLLETFEYSGTATDLWFIENICDHILSVVYFAHRILNFPHQSGFAEVQASNMSKLGEDGKPIKNADGKVQKGPNYFKPNLQAILDAHNKQA